MCGLFEALSDRDVGVLALVAQGLANKEIARQLDPPMSEETVKGHLKRIFLKLGVPNRTAAVAVYVKRLDAAPYHVGSNADRDKATAILLAARDTASNGSLRNGADQGVERASGEATSQR